MPHGACARVFAAGVVGGLMGMCVLCTAGLCIFPVIGLCVRTTHMHTGWWKAGAGGSMHCTVQFGIQPAIPALQQHSHQRHGVGAVVAAAAGQLLATTAQCCTHAQGTRIW